MRGFARSLRWWLCLAPLLAGCGDKSSAKNAPAADAGQSAAVAKSQDGGPEGGVAQAADAGDTEDMSTPPPSGEELASRMRHLLEAIAQNNPDLASDAMFPRDAYIAAKDAPDPGKAWEKKVASAFRHSVERTHTRTKGASYAKFVSFELGKTISQTTPKKKDFKKPLWRVKHSKLTFSIEGKTHHLLIAEMTAWRGNWYVSRLR